MAQILLILIISSINIIWESLQWLQLIISNAWIYGKSNNKIIYGGENIYPTVAQILWILISDPI